MNNIIKHIYKSCDPDNTDLTPASSLVDFIRPYMLENLTELQKLQVQLDPNGTNPVISKDQFDLIMSDWIAKIENRDSCNSLSDMSQNSVGTGEFDISTLQTAIYSIGSSPDMSIEGDNLNNNSIVEHKTLQEEVKKLQHQLHKTVNELELMKQQLSVSEEQNESMMAELNKLRRQHHQEQQIAEDLNKNKQQTDEIKEEASVANKKIQQLTKIVANYEKKEANFLSQISQLENENSYLKNKMQKYEKRQMEGRKSMCDIRDELEGKEAEIASLMEIIEELKGEVNENTDLVNFYTNENKLFKQKALALENLLHEILPEGGSFVKSQDGNQSFKGFNSPNLLRQLTNPISPNLNTPVIDPKRCNTSSPIANGNNSGIDLFSADIATVLRSPHKTLKEELAEVSKDRCVDGDEVKRLQEVLKEQDLIKNTLWENMKHLSSDNEILQEYKNLYDDLVYNIHEKEGTIERLQNELEASTELNCSQKNIKKEHRSTQTDFNQLPKENSQIELLKSELGQQKSLFANLLKELEIEKNKDHQDRSVETDLWQEKVEVIQRMTRDFKTLEASFNQEKQLNIELQKKLEKTVDDKSMQTDKTGFVWSLQVPETIEKKTSNYSKQQIKLERLLEKQEKTERDLNSERGINTTLSLKLQGMREENKQIMEELEFHKEKVNEQTEVIRVLLSEKHILEGNLGTLEMDIMSLQKENADLKDEKRALINEKNSLNQSLQNNINRLQIETSVGKTIREENADLVKKLHHTELRLRDEYFRQIHLKKQAIDLKSGSGFKILQLENKLAMKSNEADLLRKQLEVTNIEVFLSSNIRDLERITTETLTRLKSKFDDKLDQDLIREIENMRIENNSNLQNQMLMINNYVKLALQLLEVMTEKCAEAFGDSPVNAQVTYCIAESINTSASDLANTDDGPSETGKNVEECTDVVPVESDSFLNHLGLSDEDFLSFRNLTKNELEEKFSSLALTFTVDFKTSKSRYIAQKEKCNRLLMMLYTYLNYSTDLLRRDKTVEQNTLYRSAIVYLQLMKNLIEDVFKAAVQCGVLQNEIRTMNCWNLVINYVASLNQESIEKATNQSIDFSSQESSSLASISVSESFQPPSYRSNFQRRIKFCIVTFLFVLLALFVMLFFYVDYLCSKDGRRICPLEWIMSCVIQKIHSHQIL